MDDDGARNAEGVRDPDDLPPEEEPNTTGTLLILMLFMMALGALWILMYFIMLER